MYAGDDDIHDESSGSGCAKWTQARDRSLKHQWSSSGVRARARRPRQSNCTTPVNGHHSESCFRHLGPARRRSAISGENQGSRPKVGPASAHRRRPGAARLRRRGHDRRRSERRHGTERRGNLDVAPPTWIARLGSSLRGLGSKPAFWVVWLLLMTAAICWVLWALKVVEWAIPLISVTVVLAGSVAIMEHQLYLGATAEQRAKDLETKLAHLQRLLNAMQTKLRNSHGINSRSRSLILARERLYSSIWEGSCRTRSSWPS